MRLSVMMVLAIRLVGPMVVCSGADALTIAWSDLTTVVAKRPVLLELNKSTEVRGTLVRQDEEGVVIAIESATRGSMLPHGVERRFERADISRFAVVKDPARIRWRTLGVIGGYFAGMSLGFLAGGREQDPRLIAGMVGGIVGGYYWGKSLDKRTLEIRFLETSLDTAAPPPKAATLPGYLQRTDPALDLPVLAAR